MLEAKALSKRFGARIVLKNLDFQVEAGQCLAVVGRNGAGKSTLLRLVAGLIEPSRGEVRWDGQKPRSFCALAAPDALQGVGPRACTALRDVVGEQRR
ncbi:ATP-binding cassette domain-containing protein, partial [bacterium]